MTEYWRSIIPDILLGPPGDAGETRSTLGKAAEVRSRYVLEIKHLGRSTRSSIGATTGITRTSEWSPLTPEERQNGRPGSPFALCLGIPSGRADTDQASPGGPDFAILVHVGADLLPKGALFLGGVPLVVHRHRRFRPLPYDADVPWQPEPAIRDYSRPAALGE